MKGGANRKQLELKDFSGGLVTKSPPKNIDPKYSVDCLNVYTEGAMLRPRGGVTVVNPTAATGEGNGAYNWIRTSVSTNQWLVMVWGSVLTKMDVVASAWDGSVDTISVGSAGTALTAAVHYFANFNGVLLVSNENRDRVQRMTISDTSYQNIETGGTGTAPLAKYITVWKNHAWFFNVTGAEDRVARSSVNSYNNFTGDTAGSNDILTENDIGITGHFQLDGRLYAMKAFSIHRFTYTGSISPLVDIRPIRSRIGTVSPRTVKNVNTPEGEVVLFLGTNQKLYMCDGMETKDLSDSIDITNGQAPLYMKRINSDALDRCHAVIHDDLNHYELFICIGTGTGDRPTHSIVFDYVLKAFWPNDARIMNTAIESDNGAGRRRVYAQAVTSGNLFLLHQGDSDNGSAINAYWTSSKLGQSIVLQKFDEIEVETSSVACAPTFKWRADWETTWVSNTMRASTNSHNWNPGRVDNMIQFQIVQNSTAPGFRLWTIIGSERAIGGGK